MFKIFDRGNKKGAGVLSLILAVILFVAVAIPVAVDVIANVTPKISGTTLTVVNLVPVFLALGLLITIARSSFGEG